MLSFLTSTELGKVRSNTNQYFSAAAYDTTSTEGSIFYQTTGTTSSFTSLPAGLSIDPTSGYIYGYINTQTEYLKSHSVTVRAIKVYPNRSITSATNTYTLTVLSNHPDIIKCTNSSSLSLIAGIPSDLSLTSTHTESTYNLQYSIVGTDLFPPGVSLNKDTGHIVGIPSTVGTYTTRVVVWSTGTVSAIPFDTNLTSTTYAHAFTTQTVTINVAPSLNNYNYTGIHVKPHLSINKRIAFSNFINDFSIFIPDLIYRSEDNNFGVQEQIKMYIEFGVQELNLSDYIPALNQNFNRRRLIFGDVKVAQARDNSNVHLYDVIYVDVIDNINGVTPVLYSDNQVYYPNSVQNMRDRLSSIVLPDFSYISVDEYYLPKFMRTPQLGSYLPTEYITVVPLCYVLPGKSGRIVRKIKKSGFDFKQLDFDIDRIYVDQSLDHAGTKYLVFPRTSITETITYDSYIIGDDGVIVTDDFGNPIIRD